MRIFASQSARTAWFVIGVLILAAIWIGSLLPVERLPRVSGGDKLHHFAAYAACAFWWCLFAATWRVRAAWAGGLALMGAVIEVLQGASGFRYFETADMIANAAGALAGGSLAAFMPARSRVAARAP